MLRLTLKFKSNIKSHLIINQTHLLINNSPGVPLALGKLFLAYVGFNFLWSFKSLAMNDF